MEKILSLILIGLFLAGCAILPNHPNLFENPACEPPCWENITPGVTTKADVIATLAKINGGDKPIVDSNQPVAGFDDAVTFTFYNNGSGLIYIRNNRVSMISFVNNLNITLQEAIALFGTPQNISIYLSGEDGGAIFIDPEKGIVFGSNFLLNKHTEIGPKDEIDYVYFFDPKQLQWYLNYSFLSYYRGSVDGTFKNMHPWRGYGSVDQYTTPVYP